MPDSSPHPGESDPARARLDAIEVLERLRQAGHEAYFAGGCVRDLLLGRAPTDYDIATDAPPETVRRLFRNTQAVGQVFGVILVRHHGQQIEVATFRSDGAYLDGRHPTHVQMASAPQDAQRRDFTINGLFLDPLENRVIDHVNGQADLASGIIRAIGQPEKRFEEDHLRMLRAVRFAARLGFAIEPATLAAIRHHAPQLSRISPERIGQELRAMLTPPTRRGAWPLLWETDLLRHVLRHLPIAPTIGTGIDPARSIFLSVAPGQPISFGLALAAAIECIAAMARQPLAGRDAKAIRQLSGGLRLGLKISNEDTEEFENLLWDVEQFLGSEPLRRVAGKKRFLARPTAAAARLLVSAIAAALPEHQPAIHSLLAELSDLEQTDFAPPPLITGDDLTAAGLRPGPTFKHVLDAVYDAQLEGRVTGHAASLALALQLAGK